MTRRSTITSPKGLSPLTADQLRAGIDRLRKRTEEVKQFDPTSIIEQYNIPHVDRLAASIDEALVRTFGVDSLDYDRYKAASTFDNGPHNYAYEVPLDEVHRSLDRSKQRGLALLDQAIETLEERLSELADLLPVYGSRPDEKGERPAVPNRKIFIVHGHAEEPREAVARFLEQLGLEPIILHERANQGRTIIEKFEAHAGVGFAIVLLTPDDLGGSRPGGRLGRSHVVR
jgi:hypothetical protein